MQALGFVKALLTAVQPQSFDQMYFGRLLVQLYWHPLYYRLQETERPLKRSFSF